MYNKEDNPTKVQREKHIPGEEIDLNEVFRAIGNLFKSIGRGINYVISLVLRKIILISAFVALGAALGFAFYYVSKPYYTSSMTLMLANIRNEFIEDQLNKLSIMIEENNFEAVAERLEITEQSARQIKSMDFSNLDQERVEEDSVLTGSPFRIELALYDRKLFDNMEPALTSYLENNRYFSKLKTIKQRQVESMISKLEEELSSIDSMKMTTGSPRGPVNGFVYGQPIDPTNLYKESVSMYKEQVELEAYLANINNVEVVTGFIPKLKPSGPSLMRSLGIGGAVAFVIGFIVALNLDRKSRR